MIFFSPLFLFLSLSLAVVVFLLLMFGACIQCIAYKHDAQTQTQISENDQEMKQEKSKC